MWFDARGCNTRRCNTRRARIVALVSEVQLLLIRGRGGRGSAFAAIVLATTTAATPATTTTWAGALRCIGAVIRCRIRRGWRRARGAGIGVEIGRASCRDRVWQYV